MTNLDTGFVNQERLEHNDRVFKPGYLKTAVRLVETRRSQCGEKDADFCFRSQLSEKPTRTLPLASLFRLDAVSLHLPKQALLSPSQHLHLVVKTVY